MTAMRYSVFSVNDHHPRLARTVPELYRQVMRQCELGEALGYDTFFCAEHHFHEYGVVPDPAVMLAALAQRTKSIRLGTAISILTVHDPRRIAETYSMVDMMSGGRLVFGVGSGYLAHEFQGYDADPKEKRDRNRKTQDHGALAGSLDGKRCRTDHLFHPSLRIGLSDTRLPCNQPHEVVSIVWLHARPAGCRKQDPACLRAAVCQIALLASFRPK